MLTYAAPKARFFLRKTLLFMSFFRCLLPLLLAVPSLTAQSDTLRLVFVGDIMGHGPQIRAAEVVRDSVYDFTPNYRYVRPLLERADFAVGNLEVTLTGRPPYTGYPRFRSPDALATALREAGFDLLVTANNHSNDGGRRGVVHTIEVLEREGFYHTGTFRDARMREALYPLIVYRKDFKLIFLNCTYDTNGIPTPAPTVVNEIDTAEIRRDLAVARQFAPDFTFMFIHWGDEYQRQESRAQRTLARHMLGWGADAVIGAHPHVVQPIRMEHPTDQEAFAPGLVAYSLGNFISNQRKPHTDGGILLEVDLVRDGAGTRVVAYHYTPVYRHIRQNADGSRTYFAVPPGVLDDAAALEDLNFTEADAKKRDAFYQSTREHLANDPRATKPH